MEGIIKAIEKAMVGTILRGLLWVFAWVSATFGVESPPDETAQSVAGWVGAILAVVLALGWSRIKDRIWKNALPGG